MSLCTHSPRNGRSLCPRLFAIGLVAVACTAALAGGLTNPTGTLNIELLDNSPDRIAIEFNISDFDQQEVRIGNDAFLDIQIPGEPQLKTLGAPALPHVARSIIIPDDAAMTAKIDLANSSYYEIQNVDVAPSKGYISHNVNPADVPHTFGEQYDADAFYPGNLVTLGSPYIQRDYRAAVVDVFPFQYNPVSRTLRVYTRLTVDVVTTGTSKINVLHHNRADRGLSRAFHEIYQSHFINYEPQLRYDPIDEVGDMLIICHDAWISNMEPLAAHKNGIGIDTTIVGVSTIGNSVAAIQSYIQGVYDTSDLAFVLLVGDSTQIVSPIAVDSTECDPIYAKLAGNDDYPEIIIGRFSAETAAHVDTQVQRTIEYENMPATTQDWFWRGTGVASDQGTGDDGEYDNEHIGNIRTDMLAGDYTLVDAIYDPSGTAAQVSAALNAGRGIINYCGHGSTTSWGSTGFSNSHVNALTNDGMLPFICSVACVNGNFAGNTCFAEAWLRATSGGQPSGAIATYMSTNNQPWSPPMEGQDEFNILLMAQTYHSFGALCYAGSCSMMDDYPGDDNTWGTGPATFNAWLIFGDPSLRVVGTVAPPEGMGVTPSGALNAEGQQGGPFTPNSIDYVIENFDATPIDYEVSVDAGWVTVTNGAGTVPALSTATVTVSLNAAANVLGNGTHTASVDFVNTTDHVGDTTRAVSLTVGVPTLQYEWNMDTDPGWDTEGQWAWGHPTGQGGDHEGPDPNSGHTGQYVYGYNLNGDYTNNMPEYDLTSDAIDCSELTEVGLKFWRWLGVEQPTYDHAYLRASNNGTTWTDLWTNTTMVYDGAWTFQEYDLSAVADGQDTVYLRWTMGSTDSSWLYCGWNIDDIEIWGLAASNPFTPGDLDCDGDVDFDDIDPFVLALGGQEAYEAAYPDCRWLNADCDGDGDVDFDDIDAFVALIGG